MDFCTLATNYVTGGAGGKNTAAGISGKTGATTGWNIFRSVGVFDLSASIMSYGTTGTNFPNAVGVTDAGYNICSDASLTKSTIITTTRLNANPFLDSGLALGESRTGGTFGGQIFTLALLTNSPASRFVPGVPGATFPLADEILHGRTTPTSAGAFELNPIPSISTNPVLPTIISTLPATNLTGAGGLVSFTNTVDTKLYSNPLPFGYQWQFNGSNISDNANYSGTASNILTVRKITIADQGKYTVLVSPTLLEGATTSTPPVELILTNPPSIKTQPVSQLNRPSGAIVSFSLGVVSPLNFNYQWLLGGNNLPNRGEYSGTNSNVLTINPATTNDAGYYSVIVSNDYGARTSIVVRLTIMPDHARPTVAITSPLANVRTNTLVIEGTASDNAQVTNVYYWFTNLNAGLHSTVTTNVYGNATLTTNGSTNFNGPNKMLWTITNMPLPGTNILAVQSVDFSGNVSPVVTRRFFYQVPSVLGLTIVSNGGGGTLTGHSFIHRDTAPSNNASLNIGEGYSIVAAPNASSLLGSWTTISGTNVVTTNGNTLHFIMESPTTIQASFVSNIFLVIHGVYNGLFYVLPEFVTNEIVTNLDGTNQIVSTNSIYTNEVALKSAGMLNNLALGKGGTFSGRLLLAGGSYLLNGAFDAFGHASNTVARSPALGGPLIVAMNADTNGSGIITGTVSNAAWPTNASLWAGLSTVTLGASNYTLLMLPPTNAPINILTPTGYGYTLIADHGGTVTLSGGLADGTAFTQTVPALQANNVPVYVSLYGKTGFLFGWLNLTNLSGTNTTGELIWIKGTAAHPSVLFPDGFTNLLLTAGSVWTNPGVISLSPTNRLAISGSGQNLDYTVAVKNNN
jgi:hypothetical protein